jgi:hypothetical protein
MVWGYEPWFMEHFWAECGLIVVPDSGQNHVIFSRENILKKKKFNFWGYVGNFWTSFICKVDEEIIEISQRSVITDNSCGIPE